MSGDRKNVIAQRLKIALSNRGKTQKELAAALGLKHENQISYFCSGTRVPNTEQLAAIADFLEVSTDYLLGIDKSVCADPDVLTELEQLFCDVNVNEIAGQIQLDSLSRWCASWRKKATELTAALKGE